MTGSPNIPKELSTPSKLINRDSAIVRACSAGISPAAIARIFGIPTPETAEPTTPGNPSVAANSFATVPYYNPYYSYGMYGAPATPGNESESTAMYSPNPVSTVHPPMGAFQYSHAAPQYLQAGHNHYAHYMPVPYAYPAVPTEGQSQAQTQTQAQTETLVNQETEAGNTDS